MTELSQFRPYIAPEVPGCPGALIDRAVVRAARKLCEETFCWQGEEAVASVPAGRATVALEVPACAEVLGVAYLTYHATELPATSPGALAAWDAQWHTRAGTPTHYLLEAADAALRLYPKPLAAEPRVLRYALLLRPTVDATALPDLLWPHVEALAEGALGVLLAQRGQAWSDVGHAERYRVSFKHAIYRLRDAVVRAYAVADLTITPETLTP